MQRKLKKFAKKFDSVRFYVKPLCELQLFAALDANDMSSPPAIEFMSISLLHFTAFFQGDDKSIERGENHYESGHV